MDKDKRLLKDLIMIPSPSGYERNLAEHIRAILLSYIPKSRINIDFHNNVIATIPGQTEKLVMIDAHSDQLGFLINNIDKGGYISLVPIGGHDLSLLRGRKVLILNNKKETITGVIGCKPIHLMEDEVEEVPNRTSDVTLDIGVRGYKKVSKIVSIGDPVILQPEFGELQENYYMGSGFDDKAGCYMLIKMIKDIIKQKTKPYATLKFVFSVQEEVGCRGAKEVAFRYQPDLFIGADVTFATDQPDVDERRVGRCVLGQGIAIYKGVNIHQPSVNLLTSIANKNKYRVQYLATSGAGGTNAKSVANICDGIKIVDLGIPLRNMHSPVEVINLTDINNAAKMLKDFVFDKRMINVIEKS